MYQLSMALQARYLMISVAGEFGGSPDSARDIAQALEGSAWEPAVPPRF